MRRARAGTGRSMCEIGGCPETATQVHHPFGRISEPWCSSALVCVALCHGHHERIHRGDVELRDALRLVALNRMRRWAREEHELDIAHDPEEGLPLQFDTLRQDLAAHGIEPPGYSARSTKETT